MLSSVNSQGQASSGPSGLSMLTGEELLVECLDEFSRSGVWSWSDDVTSRFIDAATDPLIRSKINAGLRSAVDRILVQVHVKCLACSVS